MKWSAGSRILGCSWPRLVVSMVHNILGLSSGHLRLILTGIWSGGAIPAACRVILLAVRTPRCRGRAAAEDRVDVATLRAGRVRTVMRRFGMGERAKWADKGGAGAAC